MTDSTMAQAITAYPEAPANAGTGLPHPPETRLRGRALQLARRAWAVGVVILVGLYILLLPACVTQLQTICRRAPCALIQPTPASAAALKNWGFSVAGYAALTTFLIIVSSLVCFVVAGIIVWRKSDDWMALLVALAEVALGTELVPYLLQTSSHSQWQMLAVVTNALDFAVLFLVFALFPGGSFVPRWTRWLVVGWILTTVALVAAFVLVGTYLFTFSSLIWLVVLSSLVAAQLYRYRMVSRPRERAQTRWVIFGATIAVIIILADFVPVYLFPALAQPGSLYLLVSAPIYTVPIIIFSICLGVAVLRYRLYDIDVIIRRTLIYTILSGALATIYAISSIVLQAVFVAVTRQGNGLAIVASTLAIGALFQPVRSRVQSIVDRRFFRSRYDAARTVAAFGDTLHGEVDLAQLSERLLAAVDETMRPAHISLWIAAPHGASTQRPAQGKLPVPREKILNGQE